MTLGEKVTKLRKLKGFSLIDLASIAGVPYVTLYKIEKSAIKNPTVGVMSKIASVLGVSLDYFREN